MPLRAWNRLEWQWWLWPVIPGRTSDPRYWDPALLLASCHQPSAKIISTWGSCSFLADGWSLVSLVSHPITETVLQPLQRAWTYRESTLMVGWCLLLNSWFFTLEPPVFELPLACWFQNCFCFQDWTYFSCRYKLLTTKNHKAPPLWWNPQTVEQVLVFWHNSFKGLCFS